MCIIVDFWVCRDIRFTSGIARGCSAVRVIRPTLAVSFAAAECNVEILNWEGTVADDFSSTDEKNGECGKKLTIFCAGKFESIEQRPYLLSKLAAGKPQEIGLGCPEVISAGIDDLGNMYILMKSLVHHIAYTPPPFLLNEVPYDDLTPLTLQPTVVLSLQSVFPLLLEPVCVSAGGSKEHAPPV